MKQPLTLLTALLLALPTVLHAGVPSSAAKPSMFCVGELQTDYRVNPLGLEVRHLRFSWRVNGGDQSAWQLQVAGAPNKLLGSAADLWDSGKRDGGLTTKVAYEGTPLASRQRVWWRVRAWDQTGKESAWSEPAWFETGLLNEADWNGAQWIGCNRDYSAPQFAPQDQMGPWIEPPAGQPVISLFKDLELPEKPVVSAMAWWGLSKVAGESALVANYEQFKGLKRTPLDHLMNAGRFRPYGFADLAFLLQPGRTNRIELRFKTAATNFAATLGLRIVFADGTKLALASAADWQAKGAEPNCQPHPVRVAEPYGGSKFGQAKQFSKTDLPPAWFRGKCEVRAGLKQARLYLCALGQGNAFVNGAPVDDSLMGPPQSDYEAFAFYTTHDITPFLKPGANAISVLLDAGWFHEVGGFGAGFSYGRPGLKVLVAMDYGDGRTEWLISGPGWQWKEGAIRTANIYRGEVIDYRRDHDEWKSAEAGTGWGLAQVLPPLSPKTMASDINPIRRGLQLKPVKSWQTGAKTWLFDLGEMIHGWVRFTLQEPAGTTVRLRYSEFARDGVMENVPGSQWWCHGVTQGDQAISDGKPHVFESTFTTKSFRFVEISGLSQPPEDLVAFIVSSDVRPLATFESSDPMLNRLFANGMRTYRNYVIQVLRDIPRERCMWGAESIYTEIPATYCYDLAPNHRLMNRLWLTGAMSPQGIPGDIGVGKRLTQSANSYIWSVTPVFIASLLFEHYGDLEPARTYYDKIRFIVQYPETSGKMGGTVPKEQMYTDHAPVMEVKRNRANGDLLSALIYFEALHRFARLADGLGKPPDAVHAREQAEKVRATIRSFYDAEKHTFGNGTQDSLALAFKVFEDTAENDKLAASLVGYYRANGHQFDGGFLSYEVYPQLSRHGYVDDAVKMLVNTTPPGPARSVKEYDATSFWEIYWLDHDRQMDAGLNFVANAHSIGWMITDLAGIRYDSPPASRSRLVLTPKFPAALTYAKSSVEIPSGIVCSAWRRDGKVIRWHVAIPWNTTTTVELPGADAAHIQVNGRPLKDAGLRLLASQPLVFELTGGEWELSLSESNAPMGPARLTSKPVVK